MKYLPVYKTFYSEKQSLYESIGLSLSPLKPYRLMKKLHELNLLSLFIIENQFDPFNDEDFLTAHSPHYVKNFFLGNTPYVNMNGLRWSEYFAESIRYTNSSLYNAQRFAILNPNCITFSPTSGFHQASPEGGMSFCTFSGQVISAVKLYREMNIKTAWLDLDGHLGTSIEDSRYYVPDLKFAIPIGMNLNPITTDNYHYIENLTELLNNLENEIMEGNINSICFAQGADSHEWDDLAPMDSQLSTEKWIHAHRLVFEKIKKINIKMNRHIPLTLSLFGGHRKDNYDSVINLHIYTLLSGLEILSQIKSNHSLIEDPIKKQIYLQSMINSN